MSLAWSSVSDGRTQPVGRGGVASSLSLRTCPSMSVTPRSGERPPTTPEQGKQGGGAHAGTNQIRRPPAAGGGATAPTQNTKVDIEDQCVHSPRPPCLTFVFIFRAAAGKQIPSLDMGALWEPAGGQRSGQESRSGPADVCVCVCALMLWSCRCLRGGSRSKVRLGG